MEKFIKKQIESPLGIMVLLIAFSLVLLLIFDQAGKFSIPLPELPPISFPGLPEIPWLSPFVPSEVQGIKKFSSEQEFKSYLEEGLAQIAYSGFFDGRALEPPMLTPKLMEEGMGIGGAGPERVSETTVQVPGIDEPDIVKTDGKEIYFSQSPIYYILEKKEMMPEIWPPPDAKEPKTKAIRAFPPADLKIDAEIEKTGDLLLSENILVIFSGQDILGYDVSHPQEPQKKWDMKLQKDNYLVSARLYQNKIYLVSQSRIDDLRPCPIEPVLAKGVSVSVKCQDIYHPTDIVPVDVTFVSMILNPASGDIEKTVSFVGSSGSSVVYMSENAIYITYSYYESVLNFYSRFLKDKCKDLFPLSFIDRIEKLTNYDISQRAKMVELSMILENYYNSLDKDERLRIENELTNRMSDYYKEHMRDLDKTGIVKINIDGLLMAASGVAPGYLLNQFALDEYQGNLRIATTVGERLRWEFGAAGESANDVYVLDGNLKISGSLKNLGVTERIYSVRFIEDKGYLVTFRQVDPFYVLDLSDPKNPQLKGELKIPGYSSYLHPINKDRIIGVGQEGWQVKISLFDVSLPESPKELAKYLLDESWSEVLSTHHAFLLDKKHEIFFLPGGKGGYIFTYKDNDLKLLRAVSDISVKRAVYINDYLYIIGDTKITVLNEIDWEKVNELEL